METILIAVLVVLAAAYLAWRGLRKNKAAKGGCDSGCGCAGRGRGGIPPNH